MFKNTKHHLKRLEALLEELEYKIRYEKGNFQSGYCIVENTKMVVINKFFEVEGRINCLLDVLSGLDLEEVALSEAGAKLMKELKKQSLIKENQE